MLVRRQEGSSGSGCGCQNWAAHFLGLRQFLCHPCRIRAHWPMWEDADWALAPPGVQPLLFWFILGSPSGSSSFPACGCGVHCPQDDGVSAPGPQAWMQLPVLLTHLQTFGFSRLGAVTVPVTSVTVTGMARQHVLNQPFPFPSHQRNRH